MKNKTSLALTLPVIFAPMLYGIAMYSRLPSVLATHWGMQNQVNGTMPKAWFLFATPFLMALFQAVVILVPRKKAAAPRFERMVIWIMPVITLVAYITTVQINLGHAWDIRRIAMLLVAAVMLVIIYQPYRLIIKIINWSCNTSPSALMQKEFIAAWDT
jgi:uncharacterized membrane protein